MFQVRVGLEPTDHLVLIAASGGDRLLHPESIDQTAEVSNQPSAGDTARFSFPCACAVSFGPRP